MKNKFVRFIVASGLFAICQSAFSQVKSIDLRNKVIELVKHGLLDIKPGENPNKERGVSNPPSSIRK